jgi:adenylate cyclase
LMAAENPHESEEWRKILTQGHKPLRVMRSVMRVLPSAPRCKVCQNPFSGFGGKLVGLAGFRRSRKNPSLCSRCCESLPEGGAQVDIAVVFADVRGSTAVGERLDATAFAAVLTRFYKTATDVLVRYDAIIDKLIGDEVMALFIPGIAGPEYRRKGADAAVDLVRTVSSGALAGDVAIGAAVHAGIAFVGNVGGEGTLDFTALGDPVNVAARLQSHAAAGEVLFSEEAHAGVRDAFPDTEARVLELRGRAAPVRVFAVKV